MGKQVYNNCCLKRFRLGYKCYLYPIYRKSNNVVVVVRTVTRTQLDVDLSVCFSNM